MRKPSRRRSMTCSDLEEIASSAHGLERFPKCGPLRKEIYADIENLPIALSAYPTTGTTPLPRRTNHTKSRRGLYFRQVSASRISITKRYHRHRRADCPEWYSTVDRHLTMVPPHSAMGHAACLKSLG